MTIVDPVVVQFAPNHLNPVVGATAKQQAELNGKTRLVLRCDQCGLVGSLLDEGPHSRYLAEAMVAGHERSHQCQPDA